MGSLTQRGSSPTDVTEFIPAVLSTSDRGGSVVETTVAAQSKLAPGEETQLTFSDADLMAARQSLPAAPFLILNAIVPECGALERPR